LISPYRDITIFHRTQENGAFMSGQIASIIISQILAKLQALSANFSEYLILAHAIINWARISHSPIVDGMAEPS